MLNVYCKERDRDINIFLIFLVISIIIFIMFRFLFGLVKLNICGVRYFLGNLILISMLYSCRLVSKVIFRVCMDRDFWL